MMASIRRFCSGCYYFFFNSITYETITEGSTKSEGEGSIIAYDFEFVALLGWMLPLRGAIFKVHEIVIIIVVLVVVVTIIARSRCKIGEKRGCLDLPDASTNYLTLMTLCSFVIAFFANTVISRWWAVSQNIQALLGSCKEGLMILLGAISGRLENESIEERSRIIQQAEPIVKYLCGLWLLTANSQFCIGTGSKVNLEDSAMEREFFTEDEIIQLLRLNNNNPQVMQLVTVLTSKFYGIGKADILSKETEVRVRILENLVSTSRGIRNASSQIGQYCDIQLPFAFIQVVCAVVFAFSIQLIVVCSSFVAKGEFDVDNNGYTFIGYLTVVLYGIVLFGMLKLLSVLENPIGRDAGDLPTSFYHQSLKKLFLSMTNDWFSRFKSERDALIAIRDNATNPPQAAVPSANSQTFPIVVGNQDNVGELFVPVKPTYTHLRRKTEIKIENLGNGST